MLDVTTTVSTKRNRIYTRRPVQERFWSKVNKTETCWLWTGATRNFGYGVINMGGKSGKTEASHRLSWFIHYGPIPSDMCVCHHCDNPLCVRPDHLFIGTRADNNHDMQRKGRHDRTKRAKGERHGGAKVTEAQVVEIRAAYDAGSTSLHKLANIYGISYMTIWHIIKRHNWKHV